MTKYLLITLVAFPILTNANEPSIKTSSECRSHFDNYDCAEAEDIAKTKALLEFKENFKAFEDQKVIEVTKLCSISMDEVEKACNVEDFNQREKEINEILNSFAAEEQRKNQTYISSNDSKSESTNNLINQIIERLKKISLNLTEKTNQLEDLKTICEQKRNASNEYCVRPIVEVEDLVPAEKTEGNAIAAAQLTQDMTLKVGETDYLGTDLVGRTQRQTTVLYREVADVSNRTLNVADTGAVQIEDTIRALQSLVVCEGCPTPGPIPPDPTPEPGPRPRPRPVPTPPVVDNPPNSDSGVTSADLIAEANSNSYGPAGGVNGSGGQGGLSGALGSLSGVFGKTGGGFGSEGYTNSSNARYSNNSERRNSNARFNLNDQVIDYSNNSNENNNSAALPKTRAFNPSSGNNLNNNNQNVGPQGQGLNGAQSNSANVGSTNKKPSLLSRLFGKKKDKTLFGKNENSSNGTGYKSDSSKLKSVRSNTSNNNTNSERLNSDRKFDPSKYAPSKEAQVRAHARATGRKVASQSSPNDSFKWPEDISLNKKSNIFQKVNLTHKIKLLNQ